VNELKSMNELKAIEYRIHELDGKATLTMLQIGDELNKAKQLLPFGEWEKWLAENINYSTRTARLLMQAANVFDPTKRKAISDLSITKVYLIAQADPNQQENLIEAARTHSTRELKKIVMPSVEDYRILPEGFADSVKKMINDCTTLEDIMAILDFLYQLQDGIKECIEILDSKFGFGTNPLMQK